MVSIRNGNERLRPGFRAVFCAFLSLVTIVVNLWLTVAIGRDYGGWAIGFICFLPDALLFFCLVASMSRMLNARSRYLRRQIAELQRGNNRESH